MAAELRVAVAALGGHRVMLGDVRSRSRALRASWHHEAGLLVVSLWRGDACVGTVRLSPHEATHLAEVIVAGLAEELPPEELPPEEDPASASTA